MSNEKACRKCRMIFLSEELDAEKLCPDCAIKLLTVESIKDFQVCELYYKYKYRDQIEVPIYSRELMVEKFHNTLKRVASFFFYKKQAESVPSYNAILNRWEKLWFPKNITAYDMAVEQHEITRNNMASYSNIAAASLERFHQDFSIDKADPIMIDQAYTITLDDQSRLIGNIDLVLRHQDRYRVMKWVGSRKKDALSLDLAAMKFAFEYRHDVVPGNVEYVCYNITSAHSPYVDVPQPTSADVNALLYWAQEVVSTDTFVPRRGFTAYCKNCPFDRPCFEFDEWPDQK